MSARRNAAEKVRTPIEVGAVVGSQPADVYRLLGTTRKGLSGKEAASRLESHGRNTIREPKGVPIWRRFGRNLINLCTLALWIAVILAFYLSETTLAEVLVVVIFANAAFAFFQEYQADAAFDALRDLVPARARVLRDGNVLLAPFEGLVPGDVLVLAEGDRVSADARLVNCANLRLEMAAFTDETEPVALSCEAMDAQGRKPVDLRNVVLAGTRVALGSGLGVVYATGDDTELGRVAALTIPSSHAESTLQIKLADVCRRMFVVVVLVCAISFALGTFVSGFAPRTSALMLVAAIVATLPLGVSLSVTLSLSVIRRRLARQGIIVMRPSSLDTLGATTVVCTDTSGALTADQMTVREIWLPDVRIAVTGVGYEPEGEFVECVDCDAVRRSAQHYGAEHEGALPREIEQNVAAFLRTSALASNAKLLPPEPGAPRWHVLGDPMDAATLVAAAKFTEVDELRASYKRVFENPFDSQRKMMSAVVERKDGRIVCAKGSTAEVLERCTARLTSAGVEPLDDTSRAEVLAADENYARQGMRTVAVASHSVDSTCSVKDCEEIERDMTFVGLAAIEDPPRPEVDEALARLRRAGVRVIMVTGEHSLAALAIARRVGLVCDSDPLLITGTELEAISDAELATVLAADREVVFASVMPADKQRIAVALQDLGHVVAVTGDGVNDAPALSAADIGLAYGSGGQVASGAADVVLADDDFASVATAIEHGRGVVDNLRRLFTYHLMAKFAMVASVLVMFGMGLPLPLPLGLMVAIDLILSQPPALALGVEHPEPDAMDEPLAVERGPLLSGRVVAKVLFWFGPVAAATALWGYFTFLKPAPAPSDPLTQLLVGFGSSSQPQAVTAAFVGLVVAQIGAAFALRTTRRSILFSDLGGNVYQVLGVAVQLVILTLVVYLPEFQKFFNLAPPPPDHVYLLAAVVPALIVADELRKALLRYLGRPLPATGAVLSDATTPGSET